MRFKINWRYLLKLAAVLLVALVAVHFTHRWQVGRQAGAFLRQADAAREAKETPREIAYLRRYLMARPAETDVRERLARLLCTSARTARDFLEGYMLVEDVLRRDPGRDELRRFAIDLAMVPSIGRYGEAQAHLAVLLEKKPDDGELEGLYARCLAGAKKYDSANAWYRKAIEHRKDIVDWYAERAAILRIRLDRGTEADAVVVEMLKYNPGNFRAHLVAAGYWRSLGDTDRSAVAAAEALAKAQKLPPEARVGQAVAQAVTEAQKLAPDELDVIRAAADVARLRGYELARAGKRDEATAALAEAHRTLKAGIAKHPKAPAAYLELAALEAERQQEKPPAAVIREGLEAIPDSAPLLDALVDYQIRAGDEPAAAETLERLKARGLTAVRAELYQARLLILKREWLKASRTLEQVRQDAPADSPLSREANLFLARCYAELGLPDRRRDAARRAVPVESADPLWVLAMVEVAEAEAGLGKLDEALQAYVKLKDRSAGAWLPIARLRLLKALQAPAEKRDWRAVEEAVATAERALPDNTDVRVLRATLTNYFPAPGNPAEARGRLEALKDERPKEHAVWLALAAQDQRDGNPKRALATLAAGEKAAGDAPALRLAKARLWVETKEPDLDAKLEALASADTFTPDQQLVLVRGLAELASGSPGPLPGRLWDRVAKLQHDDLGVHRVRFDLATRAGNEAAIDLVLDEIRDIDGEAGSSYRFAQATRLIWRAQYKNELGGLDQALRLLDALERERAGWARVAFAQGMVYDLRKDAESALAKYQRAVQDGEASPDALRRLMTLLRQKGRFDEAAAVLQKLPKAAQSDSEVQRIAAEVSLKTNNVKQAVAYADKAVSDKSADPAEHIWQGQVYFGAGEREKAEAAFRKAVALRPGAPDGWLILVHSLVLTNRRAEGEKVLDEAKEKVDKAERALFLGQGYALLGRTAKAAEAFKQARAERPADVRTLQAEAEFLFQSGQSAEARAAFQRVVDLPGASAAEKDAARQMVGLCGVIDRDYAASRRALAELGLLAGDRLQPPSQNESPARRRTRIVALAVQRDRESRLEAIRLLEADRDLAPDDRLLLAQLHNGVGNRARVRVVMSELLKTNDRNALYVRFYAAWLIRDKDLTQADVWVKRLSELQPEALATAELRARLAAARGNPGAARAALLPRADEPDAPVLAIARVCEEIKLHDDAERLYRRVVENLRDKQPQAPLLLAAYYGRRGRTDEALRVCAELRKAVGAPVVGQVAVEALAAGSPTAAQLTTVAGWLDEAVKTADGANKAALTQLLASVRSMQGDYAASAALYRDALRANPRDVLAMNNLAFLVSAAEGKHDEALRLVEQARQIGGPLPEVLDTEALVRLNKGDAAGARRLLDAVLAEAPSATGYFHLAQAEQAANRREEARLAWQKAGELGLKPADLHPLERPAFDKLSALMN